MIFHFLHIGDYKSLKGARVPLDGLTVLFGPNSAGKTNVLEAVRSFISGADTDRVDRSDFNSAHPDGDPYWIDSVLAIELADVDVSGHADASWYDRAWTGELGEPISSDGAPDELITARTEATADGVRARFVDELLKGPGAKADRRLLAQAIIQARRFAVDNLATWVVVRRNDLTAETVAAVKRLAAEPEEDFLANLARSLEADRATRAVALACGAALWVDSAAVELPPVHWLRSEPEGLDREARDFIEAIHQVMWTGTAAEGFDGSHHGWLARDLGSEESQFIPDPWYESMQQHDGNGTSTAAGLLPGDWYRVRPTVHATARVLGETATSLAPTFVQELGVIEIEVLTPDLWVAAPDRVRVVFREPGQPPRDLVTLGSGLQRWIAASVRIAGRRLEGARRTFYKPDGSVAELSDEPAARELARRAAPEIRHVSLTPAIATSELVIVDEPEAHLHPHAVRSVAKWLADLSGSTLGVLVATHHPIFLGLDRARQHLVHCHRIGDTTYLKDIGGDLLRSLDLLRDSVGLSRADVLQLTRLALFVEGPHDVAVLEGLFGDELSAAGVRIFPMHGTGNALALVTSEVISALGIKSGVLTDNTRPASSRATQDRRQSKEELAIDRLLQEARAVGWSLQRYGLSKHDILEYIEDSVCQSVAPRFPGWEAATAEWRASGTAKKWKPWITERYGLRLSRTGVADLVAAMQSRSHRPPELRRVVDEIVAAASSRIDQVPSA